VRIRLQLARDTPGWDAVGLEIIGLNEKGQGVLSPLLGLVRAKSVVIVAMGRGVVTTELLFLTGTTSVGKAA